jgi:hypothetical protein
VTGQVGRLWSRWVRFLDRREPGTTLALWRIAVGSCLFGTVAAVALAGVVPALWLGPADGGYTEPQANWLFRLLGGATRANVWVVVGVTLAAALLTTVGLGGRWPLLLALQGFIALFRLNPAATGAHDAVITNSLWLLFLSRSTVTLSLDCRLRTGRWTCDVPVPAWPRYLAVFQLVLIYFTSGVQKLSATWTPVGGYSALYYILQQPTWQRGDMSRAAWVYPLTQLGTAISWLWEVASPLLLLAYWYRATPERPGRLRRLFNRFNFRRGFVLIGLAVHLGILAFLEVGPFSWIMVSLYICLYHPDEWRAASGGRASGGRASGGREAAGGTTDERRPCERRPCERRP